MSIFSATEITERKPIWLALSDLFLDTAPLDYGYIARVCAESRFTIDELEMILKCEVAPVLLPNLSNVAGQWIGFNENWLVGKISNRKPKKTIPLQKTHKFLSILNLQNNTNKHWITISYQIEGFRKNLVIIR